MLTRDDLIDLLVAGLAKAGPAAAASAPGATAKPVPAGSLREIKGRVFLSEYEIKKRLTPGGNRLTIPRHSIVSPLALDWLTLQGIQITRE